MLFPATFFKKQRELKGPFPWGPSTPRGAAQAWSRGGGGSLQGDVGAGRKPRAPPPAFLRPLPSAAAIRLQRPHETIPQLSLSNLQVWHPGSKMKFYTCHRKCRDGERRF